VISWQFTPLCWYFGNSSNFNVRLRQWPEFSLRGESDDRIPTDPIQPDRASPIPRGSGSVGSIRAHLSPCRLSHGASPGNAGR
ncbi:MAG: hypothetical protein ACK53Y_03530, partial [bacterium]